MTASSDDRISKVQPLREWVFIKVDPRPEKVGALYLPEHETGIEKVQEKTGVVVALGEGKVLDNGEFWLPKHLEVGARVLFRGFYGDVHNSRLFSYFDGEDEYTFLNIESCYAVIGKDVEVGHLHPVHGG